MHRRESLTRIAGGMLASTWTTALGHSHERSPAARRAQLSKRGSGRASAYAEAVKTVSVTNRTHVTWLDSVKQGFLVRIRTLDRDTRQWSPVHTLGTAHDNHGGPSLSVDSEGFLHVVYGPHHHPFRYRMSQRPNDASGWRDEQAFGAKLTYPTLVCGADDTLSFTARRSHDDQPWTVEQWNKRAGDPWGFTNTLMRASARGYSHFQVAMAWGQDHQRLHLSCRIHEDRGTRETVGYLYSDDRGRTWRRLDGALVPLPADSSSVTVLAAGGRVDGMFSHKCGSIAVSPQGVPHILYSASGGSRSEMYIARPRGKSEWQRIPLAAVIDKHWPGFRVGPSAQLTFNRQGHLFVTACIGRDARYDVVLLRSTDEGRTISGERLSGGLSRERHWFPNLERPTGHNRVTGTPGVLFTAGIKGAGNTDILSNDVYWCGG